MLLIYAFYKTAFLSFSLTFKSLPRKGNTPYLSRPTTDKPETANAFALSPSVNINTQCSDFAVPASLASYNFGTSINLTFFPPAVTFAILVICLAYASCDNY